ncbi:MAG: PorT family protein, partial [Muribaculaceae bacterium]|nr:PorT family protein [Muribaculaceae bacterium]
MIRLKFQLLVVIMLLAGFHNLASAQTHYSSNVAIGAKGGATMSQVFFNPSVRESFVPGFIGGVMVRYIEENH